MSQIKKVTWETVVVPVSRLADFLTDKNFQPGKFHLITQNNQLPNSVIIVFVKNEQRIT